MKHETKRCEHCPEDARYIASWGDKSSDTAVVGTQPGAQHPDESECVFGLDLDWTAWSGEMLEEVFDELDDDLSDYYWTNAVKCVGGDDKCAENLKNELSSFSKVILLGNDTVEIAPDFEGTAVYKLWHPAYVSRNPEKLSHYVRKWRDVLDRDSPTNLTDFA